MSFDGLTLYAAWRNDLTDSTPAAKMAVQIAHAMEGALFQSGEPMLSMYLSTPLRRKIVTRVSDLRYLKALERRCLDLAIPCHLVTDHGLTVYGEPTITCLGFGPLDKGQAPGFVKRLQLLNV